MPGFCEGLIGFCECLIFWCYAKNKNKSWRNLVFVYVCQGGRTQFNHGIPSAFCLSRYTVGFPCWITFSSLKHLPNWNTFCNHPSSHHSCSCVQHCLCESNFSNSQHRVPSHIQAHLFSFWNSYLWATYFITHFSVMVVLD